MGRKRTKGREHLPKGVIEKRGFLIYREYLGKVAGKYRFGPEIRLCRAGEPASILYREYAKVLKKETAPTLRWLLSEYFKSDQFAQLGAETRKVQEKYTQPKITEKILRGGRLFGDALLSDISPVVVRKYLDTLRDKPTVANKHRNLISAAWRWGRQYFYGIPANPCQEVTRERTTSRDRYISDDEYNAVHLIAPPLWRALMDIAYCCRARQSEILDLTTDDLLNDGLLLRRAKGSNDEITEWSERLRSAVSIARNNNKSAPQPINKPRYLFHDRHGNRYTRANIKSQWQRLIKKALERRVIAERFTFHDIKAKGVSDHKDHHSGHKTLSAKQIYIRKTEIIKPTR